MDSRGHDTWTEGDMIHGQEGTSYIDRSGHDTWTGGDMIHGKKEA